MEKLLEHHLCVKAVDGFVPFRLPANILKVIALKCSLVVPLSYLEIYDVPLPIPLSSWADSNLSSTIIFQKTLLCGPGGHGTPHSEDFSDRPGLLAFAHAHPFFQMSSSLVLTRLHSAPGKMFSPP